MFGRDETRGAEHDRSSTPAGSTLPDHVVDARRAALPGGFRAAGVAAGIKPSGGARRRPARLRRARDRQRGALHALRRARRAGDPVPGALRGSTRCAPWPSTPATPTRRPGGRGVDAAAKHAGRRARWRWALDPEVVAVASTGVIGVPAAADPIIKGHPGRARRAVGDRRRGVRRVDPHHRRVPQARTVDVTLPGGTVTHHRPGQGRRDDLAQLRDDAVLRADGRGARAETADLLLGVCVKRSFDRISVDGQLSTNDTAILMASGARRADRARVRGRAALRRGARRRPAPARAADRARRRGRQARRPRRRHRRPRGDGRPPPRGRSPTRRSSRPRCTAATPTGAGSPRRSAARCPAPRRCRSTSGSRTCRCAASGAAVPFDLPALEQAVAGEEVEYTVAPARRGRRDRGLLLRPQPRLRDDQRGVHDVMETSAHSSRRSRTSGSSTASTVVIKYGGAAMTDPELREEFARDVVLLKYVGLNPIVVHGGGPDITAYMEALNMPVEFICGLRVSDADTVEIAKMVLVGKVNKDIVLRINRHGQPAVGLCGDDGLLFRVATMAGAGGRGHRLRGPDRARRRRRHRRTSPRTTSRSSRRSAPTATGSSHNVNADEAAGAVARALGAYKVIFLTDVVGLAARCRRTRRRWSARCAADVVEAALAGRRGRDAAEAAGLPRRDPRRRLHRPHHRRPRAALAAARAVHRRGHRHEDPAGAVSTR